MSTDAGEHQEKECSQGTACGECSRSLEGGVLYIDLLCGCRQCIACGVRTLMGKPWAKNMSEDDLATYFNQSWKHQKVARRVYRKIRLEQGRAANLNKQEAIIVRCPCPGHKGRGCGNEQCPCGHHYERSCDGWRSVAAADASVDAVSGGGE